MNTAIVILNYNGRNFLEKFLPLVVERSPDARVIVVDNGSTDTSLEYLDEQKHQVEVLVFEQNLGYAGGYNKAVELIDAPVQVLLNSDIEPAEGWLEPLEELMSSHSDMAACMPKIRAYHQPDFFEYAGASGGYIDWLGYPYCRGRMLDTLEKDIGQYDDAREVFWATGACLVVRKNAFLEAGGFDESFFAHMEEIDLCWRFHSMGLRVWVCPSSLVYHVGGGTLAKTNPRKTYLNFRNNQFLLYKNLPFLQKIFILPVRLALDMLAALVFFVKGDRKDAWAVIKAHFNFWKAIPRLRKNKNPFPLLGRAFVGKKSLIWNYYIRKKRTFSDLHGVDKAF